MNILFSIIIPTYNRAKEIGRCIDSVLSQTYKNWEAVIVDNYSDDNTEEIVASYNDSRIHYYKNHNRGVISVSRNFGIDKANGDWLCFLDSDDSWLPNKLETIVKYVDEYDLIYHGYRMNIKRTRPFQRLNCYFYSIEGLTVNQILRRGNPVMPSCEAVSRRFLGDTRFSEDISLFAVEDYDFLLQMVAKGVKAKWIKQALTLYDMTTGVSHGRIALDRDRKLYIRYLDGMTREEIREVIKYYYCRKACYFYKPGSFELAIKYFRITATAKDPYMKFKGGIRMMKSCLLYIIDKLFYNSKI